MEEPKATLLRAVEPLLPALLRPAGSGGGGGGMRWALLPRRSVT
jgi:hypothetical protein